VRDKATKDQHERFIETARALGCDEDKEKFESALRKVAAHKPIREVRRAKDGHKESK
jgi:hypothetical protein